MLLHLKQIGILTVGSVKKAGAQTRRSADKETDGDGVLRTVSQAVARTQAFAKRYVGHPDASVDAFIANRRPDSGE